MVKIKNKKKKQSKINPPPLAVGESIDQNMNIPQRMEGIGLTQKVLVFQRLTIRLPSASAGTYASHELCCPSSSQHTASYGNATTLMPA